MSFEAKDVDRIPDFALDRAFTYLLMWKAGKDDIRPMLSTLIPHAAGMAYHLSNEKVVNDTVWQITFQAMADLSLGKGVFVHTEHEFPYVFNGNQITEVEVLVLDQNGNAAGEQGGTPGQPKTRKPARCRLAQGQDADPTMPPLEDITIYINGGKVDGERYIVGYAHMAAKSKDLNFTHDVPNGRVAFAAKSDKNGHAFLFFDHAVTDFDKAPVDAHFTDGDGDPMNTVRHSVDQP
ncbi:MAG: hypothetical protein IPM46_14875 [Flavobacteriales bacterium]|nr:hypothetical protein [Flavobacteriales bacterium]